MLVGAKGQLRSGERGDEEEQSGVGEMEVGQEALNSLEFVGRVDVGGSGASVGAEMGNGLKDAGGGGAHGDDAVGG